MFGIEGIDYTMDADRIEFLVNDNGLIYGEWYGHESFISDKYDVSFPHWPYNWLEVKSLLDKVNHIDISSVADLQSINQEELYAGESDLREKYEINNQSLQKYIEDVFGKYTNYYNSIRSGRNDYTANDLKWDILSSRKVDSLLQYYNSFVELFYNQ